MATDRDRQETAERLEGYLGEVRFPATRDDLVEAASRADAPPWARTLLDQLDPDGRYDSIEVVWAEAMAERDTDRSP